jgi:replicative DNA helicase
MAQAVTSLIRDPQVDGLKLPPYSVEAEQSVLGGLLLDNTAWEKIADVLADSDFYRADHRLIYRHISMLVEDNKPADALTVSESLERSAKLGEHQALCRDCARARNHAQTCRSRHQHNRVGF